MNGWNECYWMWWMLLICMCKCPSLSWWYSLKVGYFSSTFIHKYFSFLYIPNLPRCRLPDIQTQFINIFMEVICKWLCDSLVICPLNQPISSLLSWAVCRLSLDEKQYIYMYGDYVTVEIYLMMSPLCILPLEWPRLSCCPMYRNSIAGAVSRCNRLKCPRLDCPPAC